MSIEPFTHDRRLGDSLNKPLLLPNVRNIAVITKINLEETAIVWVTDKRFPEKPEKKPHIS